MAGLPPTFRRKSVPAFLWTENSSIVRVTKGSLAHFVIRMSRWVMTVYQQRNTEPASVPRAPAAIQSSEWLGMAKSRQKSRQRPPVLNLESRVSCWCRRQDLNLHAPEGTRP